ncbi:MAG: glutamate synthase subunit alpha, partial [Actinomycetota bacterium]|nr:glutamate synthase subunit alpha [Actinomycetota bacterium]
MNRRYPLVDPNDARDACGVGFIADRNAAASYRLVRLGVTCLHNLDHRGAKSADGTGDGAGMMTRLPYRILERDLRAMGIEPPSRMALGVVMTFFDPESIDESRAALETALRDEGIGFLAWRSVPVGPMVLGGSALRSMPVIEQAIVVAPDDVDDADEFERRLFLARRAAERAAPRGLAIVSASGRTVVYKGLFTASHIEGFYWDLRD